MLLPLGGHNSFTLHTVGGNESWRVQHAITNVPHQEVWNISDLGLGFELKICLGFGLGLP